MFGSIGKLLIFVGFIIILIGCLLLLFSYTKFPLGKLPGDIYIQKKNFVFYFPLTTSIVISIILSFLLYLFFRR